MMQYAVANFFSFLFFCACDKFGRISRDHFFNVRISFHLAMHLTFIRLLFISNHAGIKLNDKRPRKFCIQHRVSENCTGKLGDNSVTLQPICTFFSLSDNDSLLCQPRVSPRDGLGLHYYITLHSIKKSRLRRRKCAKHNKGA